MTQFHKIPNQQQRLHAANLSNYSIQTHNQSSQLSETTELDRQNLNWQHQQQLGTPQFQDLTPGGAAIAGGATVDQRDLCPTWKEDHVKEEEEGVDKSLAQEDNGFFSSATADGPIRQENSVISYVFIYV